MKTPIVTSALCILACLRAMPAFPASCDSLAALALKETTVTAAQLVAAGQFSAPSGGRGASSFK
ncbi:MAG: hypothetical protein ABW292_01435, partial [Vicinamibacterales bacterium]